MKKNPRNIFSNAQLVVWLTNRYMVLAKKGYSLMGKGYSSTIIEKKGIPLRLRAKKGASPYF